MANTTRKAPPGSKPIQKKQAPKTASKTAAPRPYEDVEWMRARVMRLADENMQLERKIEALETTRDVLADALTTANARIKQLQEIPF